MNGINFAFYISPSPSSRMPVTLAVRASFLFKINARILAIHCAQILKLYRTSLCHYSTLISFTIQLYNNINFQLNYEIPSFDTVFILGCSIDLAPPDSGITRKIVFTCGGNFHWIISSCCKINYIVLLLWFWNLCLILFTGFSWFID